MRFTPFVFLLPLHSVLASPLLTLDPELPLPTSTSTSFFPSSAQSTPDAAVTLPGGHLSGYFADHLAIDTLTPVKVDGEWTMVEPGELKRREAEATTVSSSSSGSTSSASATATSSSSSSSADSALPTPLDGHLAYNFTTNSGKSCPAFLNSLLASAQFKACYPLSMLLKGSSSFFEAQKQLATLTTVLDASCAADYTVCSAFMSQQAAALTNSSNCADEYNARQSSIMTIYWGLRSYAPLYKATCIQSSASSSASSAYCYALAITNTTTTGNAYTYFLPFNATMPTGKPMTCTQCLRDTMTVFRTFTGDEGGALRGTYEGAAEVINGACGEDFIETGVEEATGSADGASMVTSGVERMAGSVSWGLAGLGSLLLLVM